MWRRTAAAAGVVLAGLVLVGCPEVLEKKVYVDAACGAINPDGMSWGTAYPTLQEGINAAAKLFSGEGVVAVLVAGGTYAEERHDNAIYGEGATTGSLVLEEGVWLYGGYIRDGERDILNHPTIIDGSTALRGKRLDGTAAYHVVLGAENSCLNGFTICGGRAVSSNEKLDGMYQLGGGMYNINCSDGWPRLVNCTFEGNSAGSRGGAMYNENSSPTLVNCEFTSNKADADWGEGGAIADDFNSSPILSLCVFTGNTALRGGAVRLDGGTPVFSGCDFIDNVASLSGGAVYAEGSIPEFDACWFSGNVADSGGALYTGGLNTLRPRLINCILYNNAAYEGAGIFCDTTAMSIVHCTFYANVATASGGALRWNRNQGTTNLQVRNSILWYDTPEEIAGDSAAVTYSDVWLSNASSQYGGVGCIGNINADPLFVNPANGDFGLARLSPCVDLAGDAGVKTDFAGMSRPQFGGYDAGALECTAVTFLDANLETAIRGAIGKPEGVILTLRDLADSDFTHLYASGLGISNLSGLQWCTRLVELDLSDNPLTDISPLSALTRLLHLDLSNTGLTTISPLMWLDSLDWLDLSDNKVSDLTALTAGTGLAMGDSLYVSGNPLSEHAICRDLWLLEQARGVIVYRDAEDTCPDDYAVEIPDRILAQILEELLGDPITRGGLATLRTLTLANKGIHELDGLEYCATLETLVAPGNAILDLMPLAGLGTLTTLDLSDNGLFDLEPLAGLPHLTELTLAGNDIRHLEPLTNLARLATLNLSDNLVDTIAPLAANTGLGWDDSVDLTMNYPGAATFPDDLATLEARGVTVLLDEDVSSEKSIPQACYPLTAADYAKHILPPGVTVRVGCNVALGRAEITSPPPNGPVTEEVMERTDVYTGEPFLYRVTSARYYLGSYLTVHLEESDPASRKQRFQGWTTSPPTAWTGCPYTTHTFQLVPFQPDIYDTPVYGMPYDELSIRAEAPRATVTIPKEVYLNNQHSGSVTIEDARAWTVLSTDAWGQVTLAAPYDSTLTLRAVPCAGWEFSSWSAWWWRPRTHLMIPANVNATPCPRFASSPRSNTFLTISGGRSEGGAIGVGSLECSSMAQVPKDQDSGKAWGRWYAMPKRGWTFAYWEGYPRGQSGEGGYSEDDGTVLDIWQWASGLGAQGKCGSLIAYGMPCNKSYRAIFERMCVIKTRTLDYDGQARPDTVGCVVPSRLYVYDDFPDTPAEFYVNPTYYTACYSFRSPYGMRGHPTISKLMAYALPGWTFDHWEGDVGLITNAYATDRVIEITLGDAAKAVAKQAGGRVNLDAIFWRLVDVKITQYGEVSFEATPAPESKSLSKGVAGEKISTLTYRKGTPVTLTATSADTHQFVGWFDEESNLISSSRTYVAQNTDDETLKVSAVRLSLTQPTGDQNFPIIMAREKAPGDTVYPGPFMPDVTLLMAVDGLPPACTAQYRFLIGNNGHGLEYEDAPGGPYGPASSTEEPWAYEYSAMIDSGWITRNASAGSSCSWTVDWGAPFDTSINGQDVYGGHATHLELQVDVGGVVKSHTYKPTVSSTDEASKFTAWKGFWIVGHPMTNSPVALTEWIDHVVDEVTPGSGDNQAVLYPENMKIMFPAIAMQESSCRQFRATREQGYAFHNMYPLRESSARDTKGYGMMQLSHWLLVNRDTIWNWKMHIQMAVDRIRTGYVNGCLHLEGHKPSWWDEDRARRDLWLRREGYARYNGGPTFRYYWWNTIGTRMHIAPDNGTGTASMSHVEGEAEATPNNISITHSLAPPEGGKLRAVIRSSDGAEVHAFPLPATSPVTASAVQFPYGIIPINPVTNRAYPAPYTAEAQGPRMAGGCSLQVWTEDEQGAQCESASGSVYDMGSGEQPLQGPWHGQRPGEGWTKMGYVPYTYSKNPRNAGWRDYNNDGFIDDDDDPFLTDTETSGLNRAGRNSSPRYADNTITLEVQR